MTILRIICLAATALLTSAIARADSIWITSSGAGNDLELANVQVQEIRDGKMIFRTPAGRDGMRDVTQVSRVSADGEPALNAAEEALASGEFDAATDAFRKALSSSAREWVKSWSAQRLTLAGQRANRFDAAAAGYVALLLRDPARATNYKPAMPDAESTFINSAINETNAALATANLSAGQKQALEAFLLELQQRRGGAATASTPAPAPAAPPPAPADAPVAAAVNAAAASVANQQAARARLDAANAALERQDFAAAIDQIKSNAAVFTEPRDQAQALYFVAEAQTGLAAAKNDVLSWQDAALAYMRVVAHFQDSPQARPFVARSMLKAAQIQEKVNDPAAASLLYDQLVQQFPADPAAADARAAAARLKRNP